MYSNSLGGTSPPSIIYYYPGIATLEASNTRNLMHPDNVFCSAQMEPAIIQYSMEKQLRPVITDHFPIITVIDLQPRANSNLSPSTTTEILTGRNELREALSEKLNTIPPPAELTTHAQFEQALTTLTTSIMEMVNVKIPKTKLSPYTKQWWSKMLDAERKLVNRLG
ncbi:hypothetical protein F4604DRAFT_1682492 [Suillus subluteus]|nr:hypothetical protein F4604DRAFT_1682492 [Suillus subluteus]